MATTEELKVLLSTQVDDRGIRQFSQQMQQVSVGAEGANRALQQAMRAAPQTMAGFRAQVSAVEQQIGRRPTLGPEAFGIAPEQATQAAAATRAVGEASHFTANEMVRLGAAAVGVGVGLSTFTIVGNLVHTALSSVIDDTIALDRAMRLNTITLGAQAAGFQQYAQTLGQQTGFTQRALLEAGTSAQQFGRQIGLVPDEIQNLVGVSAQLARVLGTDVNQTMAQLSSAMQGNQQAANALGLQLDDNYVAYTQLNGASAEYFKALSPATQDTLRYQSALEQTANITKTMPGPVQDLQKAENELNAEWDRFATTIGPGVIGALGGILGAANKILALPDLGKPIQDIPQDVQAVTGAIGGAFDALGTKVDEVAQAGKEPIADLRANLSDLGKPLQDAADALGQAGNHVVQVFSGVADASDQAVASAAALAQRAELLAARQLAATNVTQLSNERVRLQREQVDLAGEEARIRLSALPAQERMAALQRDMTEQQIRARQAALPASEALEDVQYMEQRLRLQLQSRGLLSPEERAGARRELRGLARAEPGVALTALDASRGETLVGRAATRLDMAARLQDLALQRELAPVQAGERQAQLVSAIVAAQLQAAQQYQQELTVVVNITSTAGTTEQFSQTFHNARLAADNQASMNLTGAA